MVVPITGVENESVPVVSGAPPEAAAYQSIVSPAPALAEIFTDPWSHLAPLRAEAGCGRACTVSVAVPEFITGVQAPLTWQRYL